MTNPRTDDIAVALRTRGLRPTKARLRILDLLARSVNHASAEDLLLALDERGDRMSAATLYQNLNRLAEEGLLIRFTGPDNLFRFDANLSPHHHAVCTNCGHVFDVKVRDSALERLAPVALHDGRPLPPFRVEGVKVEFRGVCRSCRKRP